MAPFPTSKKILCFQQMSAEVRLKNLLKIHQIVSSKYRAKHSFKVEWTSETSVLKMRTKIRQDLRCQGPKKANGLLGLKN